MKHFLISIIAGLVCFSLLAWKSDKYQLPKCKVVNSQSIAQLSSDNCDHPQYIYVCDTPIQQPVQQPPALKYWLPVVCSLVTGIILKVMHFLLPRWFPDKFDSFN